MSSIDKMAIKGIRSFDNNQSETIQFFSPLTLIVGHNGSGKTSIIECLKYATTGKFPPNTKGGAFIHDPQVCGEMEILAQVKLSFNNLNGDKMICTRSLSLTVQKTKYVTKTLDGTLTILKNGERSTISTRCADMDSQVPLSLGVSVAILDYVIFCHQEESTWPLSEPAALKKRFDEIFEALKYTNALDQIRSIRKEQLQTVKVDTETLTRLKNDKERASKIQTQSDELVEEIESLRSRISGLDAQMSDAVKEQDDLFKSGEEFERIIASLDRFRHERSILQQTQQELAQNITEYRETDEELLELKANYVKSTEQSEKLMTGLRSDERDYKTQIVQARQNLESLVVEEGRLQAEAQQYEQQIARREDIIKSLSRSLNIRGFDTTLDEAQVLDFKDRLTQQVRSQTSKLDRLRREGRQQEMELTNEVQALQARQTEKESVKNAARLQIQTAEVKLAELRAQLLRENADQSEAITLEAEILDCEQQITKLRDSSSTADHDHDMRTKEIIIRDLEEKIASCNIEIAAGNRQADTRAKLGLLQSELRKKQDARSAIFAHNDTQFRAATHHDMEPESFIEVLRASMSNNDRDREEFSRTFDSINQELSQIQAQISITKNAYKRQKQEAAELEAQLLQAYQSTNDMDEQYTAAEAALKESEEHHFGLEWVTKYYDNAFKAASVHACCVLCSRAFDENYTNEDFREILEAKKAVLPAKIAKLSENKQACQADLQSMKALAEVRSRFTVLQKELPQFTKDLTVQQNTLNEVVARADEAEKAVIQVRTQGSELETLHQISIEFSRLQREEADIARQIRTIENQLSTSGSIRSIDDMQQDVDRFQDLLKQTKRDLHQMNVDRDNLRMQLTTLDNRRRDAQLSLSELHGRLRDKENTRKRIEECQLTLKEHNETILDAQAQNASLQPELARLRTEFEALQTRNNDIEAAAQREVSRLIAAQNTLNATDGEINHYLNTSGPSALQQSADNMQSARNNLKALESQLETILAEIAKREASKHTLTNTERQIDDNLRIRKVRKSIEQVEAQIAELGSRNAERDRDKYRADAKRLKDKYSRLVTERAGLLGEITRMDRDLARMQKELDTEFKDADELYRCHLIKVRTMEKANEDLEKYGKALDNAIMKYHSLKMEEINKIIDELWKVTYCGTDVDTIFIKTESESKIANRSYNYRVCMIKGDAELDMRGRCSAGQKVLAAIIIRLALAECFGVNCGILALDEPTTNLDRENIESLAQSLAKIISVRRAQKNFQLIVITHDEEFLRMMGCSDYCDYYYRITRNQYQKSNIMRQRVSTVL